jgi:Tfp pilus assembly protein PilF
MVTGEVNVKAVQVKVPHKGFKSTNFSDCGDVRLSIDKLEKALKLGPLLTRPHHNLAVFLQSQGKLDIAVAEWKKVLRSDPNDADALFGLGEAYEKIGECIKAVECYQRYIDLVLPKKCRTKIVEERIQHLCKVIKVVYSCNVGGCA